jgi:phenylalanine-4-hydroxylase
MDATKGHAILDAQSVDECVIKQDWDRYTADDHTTWKTLYNRQLDLLRGHVCTEYLQGLETLGLVADQIPDYEKMNKNLRAATGWEVLAVPGLIASRPFFTMLANKQFPCGTFIRKPEQLDYLEEPDIFHDVFGHVPLLTNPAYSQYMQAYGQGGLTAMDHKGVKYLARLNWYTIEFGLLKAQDEFKIYGAGIISSFGETKYVLNNKSANYLQFDLERVLRTGYYIDDFQATYFTIDSFEQLFQECVETPFVPLYSKFREMPTATPFETLPGDKVLRKGSGEYWANFPQTKTKLK